MKIIYGRAGSGKSEYIFNEIKNSADEKIYIITPEQFSFTAEKRLLDTLENGATTRVEVLSFERMAYRVIKSVMSDNTNNIGTSGKSMIVYEAITKHQKELKFLGKSLENVDTIITQITEFKKHNITVEMLENQVENTKDLYLKAKLNDMLIIFKVLEDIIESKFIDENDLLNILSENIEKSHLFDGAVFYIDEFAGFTKQEYSVIAQLNNIAKEVYITVCSDEMRVLKAPDADVFYDNKQTIQSLCDICDIDKNQQIHLLESPRFKTSELKHLEKNIYDIPYYVYNEKPQNIRLFLAENQYTEIEHIASNIVKLVRDEGYRYQDIAVICKNIDTYSGLCKAIFSEYEIPVFIDDKKDITQNLFIKYVLSIIEVFAKSWSFDSVFNYVKTGYAGIENIYELENYCMKWGIQGRKWYENTWNYEKGDDANNYEEEQEKITKPLLELKSELIGNKSAANIGEGLYHFLCNNTAQNQELDIDAWNIVVDVIDEISKIFKDEKFSFDEYSKLLKTGLATKELGQIPQTQDKVIVGDVNRTKTHRVKAVFIIGVNDGVFPSVPSSEGFFNDKDRENLKDENFELAKGTKEKMYEENFNIYKAFTTAEEKLFVSYASSDCDGKALRKSLVISKLKRIFPNLKEESSEPDEILTKSITFSKLLNNLESKDWLEVHEWYKNNYKEKLEAAEAGLRYTNVPEKLNENSTAELYGKDLKTSVSKLETYRACPFSYYLKYGLKLSDKEKLNIKPVDTGSFMHNVIDEFFKRVEDVKLISEEDMEKIINEIVDENLSFGGKFTLTAKYRTLARRLKRVMLVSIKYVVESLKESSFEVLGTEMAFGKGANPPIEIKLDDGRRVLIEGKIDRVDVAKMADGKYIRIIDYKSSTKDIDLNKVISGLQLQLITYVDAVCQKDNYMPAGALYFTLLEPKILGNANKMTKEEIDEIIKQNFRMNGLVLADVNIVKAMDNKLETKKSDIIPVTLNDSGEINYSKSSTVTREEFEKLQKYSNKIIKQISKEILDGRIDLKPYYSIKEKKTPCSYCDYKSICQFNPKFKGNNYKYIENRPKQEILDEIKNT